MPPDNSYPLPENEELRLRALYEYDILDSLSDEDYDSITKIASQICNVPFSLIALIDKDRQWFKSHYGTDIEQTPREIAFCNFTILDKDNVLVVPDLRKDERFSKNPLVTGAPNIVFYAGAPLITPEGFVLGSICVLDDKQNNLNEDQVYALKALSRDIITKFELRKKIKELKISQQQLKKSNEKLVKFARIVSHDIKTPVATISMVARSFQKKYGNQLGDEANVYLDLIDKSAKEQMAFIDQVLKQSEVNNDDNLFGEPEADTCAIINKVISLVGPPDDIEIKLSGKFPIVQMDRNSLQQVFQNLVTNAIKYNDKEKGIIHISSKSDESHLYFTISDNGSGIKKEDMKKIFKERQTLNKTDRYGNKGTGFGLAIVKDIIESSGGSISITSEINKGTDFRIIFPHSNCGLS
ncbi:MAG: GAF domain-containing sensor histidine kinase [Chitinophagaceae bacterium]